MLVREQTGNAVWKIASRFLFSMQNAALGMKNGTQLHNNTHSHTVSPTARLMVSAAGWQVVPSQITKLGGKYKKKKDLSFAIK
jgi:hypothetical protein